MPAFKASNSVPDPARCSAVQAERAWGLLALAAQQQDPEQHFALQVGALHLARAIPDYWYTAAALIEHHSTLPSAEARSIATRIQAELESVFAHARHYTLIDALRRWDFHWEPLLDPSKFDPDLTLRRGAPMRLTTGPTPGSSAGVMGFETVFTGSGRRLGRTNYYQVENSRFVDEDSQECLPLGLAISRFLEDVPGCCEQAAELADLKAFLASRPKSF
jgi:hypothetical protein